MARQAPKKNLTLNHFNTRLDRIEELLSAGPPHQNDQNTMKLDQLRQRIATIATVSQSVGTLLSELANRFRNNANDPEAIKELADEVGQNSAELAEDVVKNTPSQENQTQEG